MKFLLTSDGLTKPPLLDAFVDLLDIPIQSTRVVYIPTAAEHIRQSGVDEGTAPFRELGAVVDVIDISLGNPSEWIERFYNAHVLCFSGGIEFRLMNYIISTGLKKRLSDLLRTRLWVGISAGSMVTNPVLYGEVSHLLYEESPASTPNMEGLGFVPFQYLPHLNSNEFPKLRTEHIELVVNHIPVPVYATDDDAALVVHNGEVKVVGNGLFREWNGTT